MKIEHVPRVIAIWDARRGQVDAQHLRGPIVPGSWPLCRERLKYWQTELASTDATQRRSEIHLRMFLLLMNTGQVEQATASTSSFWPWPTGNWGTRTRPANGTARPSKGWTKISRITKI